MEALPDDLTTLGRRLRFGRHRSSLLLQRLFEADVQIALLEPREIVMAVTAVGGRPVPIQPVPHRRVNVLHVRVRIRPRVQRLDQDRRNSVVGSHLRPRPRRRQALHDCIGRPPNIIPVLLQALGNRVDAEVGYGLPLGTRFVGTPRVGLTTSEYGRDYRVGYGLGVLDRSDVNFELGVDAQRRESVMQGEASNGLMGRATVGW